jgi:Zn-dependent peptidase ImmA (M78 family)
MAQKIRGPGLVTQSPHGLRFELTLHRDAPEGLARGDGRVLLGEEPVWFEEAPGGEEKPLTWTWVDLLEFLGRWWPWLVLEEDYPLPVRPLYPAFFLREAERRWEDLTDAQAEHEEERARRFLARHDLAMGVKGLFLPSILLLRQGNQCLISAASLRRTAIRPWEETRLALEELGTFLAEAVARSENERATQAREWWLTRERRLEQHELEVTTSLSAEARQRIEGEGFPRDGWNHPEIRVAARMSQGVATERDRNEILRRLVKLPLQSTPALDWLARTIREELDEGDRPYRQGYTAANRLRGELDLSADEPLDPRAWLEHWDVHIEALDLPECPVEAVSAWGRDHGPAILLNRSAGSRGGHEYGERATLAHEIAHLVLDREGAMPAGEVLQGRTPEYPEKRARAFAAELLLPRAAAQRVVQESSSIEGAASVLQQRYRVSRELLVWQITNSPVYSVLNSDDLTVLDRLQAGYERINGGSGT